MKRSMIVLISALGAVVVLMLAFVSFVNAMV